MVWACLKQFAGQKTKEFDFLFTIMTEWKACKTRSEYTMAKNSLLPWDGGGKMGREHYRRNRAEWNTCLKYANRSEMIKRTCLGRETTKPPTRTIKAMVFEHQSYVAAIFDMSAQAKKKGKMKQMETAALKQNSSTRLRGGHRAEKVNLLDGILQRIVWLGVLIQINIKTTRPDWDMTEGEEAIFQEDTQTGRRRVKDRSAPPSSGPVKTTVGIACCACQSVPSKKHPGAQNQRKKRGQHTFSGSFRLVQDKWPKSTAEIRGKSAKPNAYRQTDFTCRFLLKRKQKQKWFPKILFLLAAGIVCWQSYGSVCMPLTVRQDKAWRRRSSASA